MTESERSGCMCRRCQEARYQPTNTAGRVFTPIGMVLCPICGNKRCPHASNHEYSCTDSNDPGQQGSDYP